MISAESGRSAYGCLAHARHMVDEIPLDSGKCAVAEEALRRTAETYRLERGPSTLSTDARLVIRGRDAKPLWVELHRWVRLE